MRVFKVVQVKYSNTNSYFRIEEKVGFIFKRWVPVVRRESSSVIEEELSGPDCAKLMDELRMMMGTRQAWIFDNGYREYR